jgi:hypothetical protein
MLLLLLDARVWWRTETAACSAYRAGMDMNAVFVARMQLQLKIWDADLAALAAESERAGVNARAGYQERIRDLRTSRAAASRTLQRVRAAAGTSNSWETLQKILEKTLSRRP